MRRFRLILWGGLAGVVVGCGGGGGDGGPPTITSVVINGDSTVVLAGTRQLTAIALSGNVAISGFTFEWTSSDTTRARVSGSGLVTGVRLGNTNITALAVLNGTPTSVSSSAHAVRTRIGSIVITPGNQTFSSLGDGATLTAEARDALNAAVPGVTFAWVSRAPAIVSAQGRVGNSQLADISALQNGSTRVVASGDGVSDSVTATVHQVATTLGLTPITFNFDRINGSDTISAVVLDARGHQLDDSMIVWASRNTAVATVNTIGVNGARLIRAVDEGQTRVVATSGVFGDSVDVSVNLIYTSVQIATTGPTPTPLDTARINRLNGSLQLGLIVRDAGNTIVPNPKDFAWSLFNAGAIATIGSSTGLVTGNSNTGIDSVDVVARGIHDKVPLVVRQVLATIAVTPASPAPLNFVGDTQTFAAEPRDSGGATIPGQAITWSTNNAVLGIDAGGLATALQRSSASGVTVKIKATVNALTDSSRSIVVRQVPRFADLSPNSFSTLTAIGQSVQASCVVRDSATDTIPNHPCNWSALTANVVTFNPTTAKTTTITAAGNGSATINATAAVSVVGVNSVTVDQVAAFVSLLPVNFGTPDVQMKVSQSAPFIAVVRDANNNVDPRSRTDVTWSITPGTSATLSAGSTETVNVTTNATPGSETVRATIGAIFGERVVAVAPTGISFATSVQTVFTANCTGCHAGVGAPQGLNLVSGSSYALLVDHASGEALGMKRVRPFLPDSSYLVHKIQGTQLGVGGSGVRMPFGCTTNCLPNGTINTIRNWILQGALNN
ncbi:MAG TPA: Ig-like domain-containing protein [Gemmatimonadales bacterium]|nr:Ig-like domain-containing protein [Gemmatimonadales bacterium]